MARNKGLLKVVTERKVSSGAAAEEAGEPLSPGARLFHAPQLNCCIIAMMGFKKKIDVEVFKEGLSQTLIKHPRFCSKLDLKLSVEVFKEEGGEPLSPGARLFHAPQLNCCIIAMMGFKKKIDVEVFKEGLSQTLIKHPRFSSKLVFDGAMEGGNPVRWLKTKVNVDNHITVLDLDPNMESPDKFVEDYVSNLTKTPMDFTKPLWELHILNIETSEAKSTGVFRFHHSIGDGISLISLLLACARKSSDPEALPSLPIDKKKKKNMSSSGSSGFLSCFPVLFLIFKVLWNTLVDLGLFMATLFFLKDTNTPLKGSPGSERAPKRFVHRTFSLDDVKLVKNAMDVTINDVILGITQAGLSSYLNRKYGESKRDEKKQGDNLPNHIRLRSTLYVNIRPSTTIEDLAGMMEGDSKRRCEWGNLIGYILVPFHIALRDDPLDYVRDAKVSVSKKKQSLEAQCTSSSAKLTLKTLGLKVTAALTYRVVNNTTLSFSNVVGPKDEISLYGHPMTYLAPSAYGHPQALTIHFQSYMDKMTLVLGVDPNVIPDPHQLCDDIQESLKLVKSAVIKGKPSNV